MTEKISLNEGFTLKVLGENVYCIPEKEMEARVPGSVYGTLLEKGLIPDPYFRENELTATKLMENDFEYRREFDVTDECLSADGLFLVLEGIDTLSDIYLNEEKIGSTDNMHLCYEFDVLHRLKKQNNVLRVVLHSPIRYIREENEKIYCGGSEECMEGFPHLRKAHCMFGWDWGPRLPDAGIFRPVYLRKVDKARIDSVYITQEHKDGKVTLSFKTDIINLTRSLTDLRITVTSPRGKEYLQQADGSILIEDPQLWWPNGYGEQPLYTVKAELSEGGVRLDTWERKIGLRTVTVDTGEDKWGHRFAHKVNGQLIFAMGADYIPEDNLLSRVTEKRTAKLLSDCKEAHYNTIRIWGGGYYPDDYFYEICDELGLLVWQDFMFACASYELDEAFDHNIREEIRQNVRRLRHHACLALWCGNNEMETQTLDKCWKPSAKQVADYIKIFEYIIPSVVKEEDPNAFYWPSSPSSGGNYDNPWDENRGDAHYWDVWHGGKPFTEYRKFYFRYLSEFGFQSFPCLKTVESFTLPEDRNIFSRVMEMHQRNRAANGKIIEYLAQTYRYPSDFDRLLYASQLLQAEAIRYGVEHFRRYRGRCMGTIVWQLNDIWPVASWASIDYFGRWKALHYAEKKMFAPILLSCEETGELSERPFCIAERRTPIEKSVRFHVANETWETVRGQIFWELRTPDAQIKKQGVIPVEVPSFDGCFTDRIDFSDEDEQNCYVSYRLLEEGCLADGSLADGSLADGHLADGHLISEGTTLFTPPKHFNFMDPLLTLSVEDGKITVAAKAYAKSVEIVPLDGEARFSDNYFDLNGDSKTITVIEGDATAFRVRSVYDIGM